MMERPVDLSRLEHGLDRSRLLGLALVIALAAAACDSAPATDAGAPRDGAPRDGGMTTTCDADTDCDDGAHCSGVERCDATDPAAAANGCVAGTNPCNAVTETCDEASNSCAPLDCSNPDVDGDGHDAIGCGGDDCADGDARRHPGNAEVCDLIGVDEDCDPDTLHSGTEGDADADGHVLDTCFNVLDGGGENRGDDCNDNDPTVFVGQVEACDALDDDCDTLVDEGFDCVQNAAVTGTTACGRSGSRSCNETCTWRDAAFFATEVPASCDYCADSELGFFAEHAHATGSTSACFFTENLEGDAHCSSSAFRGCTCGELADRDPLALLSGSGFPANSTGGNFAEDTVLMGYGPVTVDVSIEAAAGPTTNTGEGWAVVVYRDAPTGSLLGSAADLGVRHDVAGYAFEWRVNGTDQALLRRMDGDGTTVVVATSFLLATGQEVGHSLGDSGATATQGVVLTLTPDDPDTAEDETEVRAVEHCDLPEAWQCAMSTTRFGCAGAECGLRLSPGDQFTIGATAATTARTARFQLDHAHIATAQVCP